MKKQTVRIQKFNELGWADPFSKGKREYSDSDDSSISDHESDEKLIESKPKQKGQKKHDGTIKINKEILRVWKQKGQLNEHERKQIDKLLENAKKVRSVYVLALPSEQLMFNIIRACVGVTEIKDLWFNSRHEKGLIFNN